MNCKLYCLFISAFSVFFLLYLFIVVAIGSQTLYIQVHNRLASAFALFISALIYAAIFAYLYYDQFVKIDRKADLKRWLEERKMDRKNVHEMRQYQRQSKVIEVAHQSKMAE